MQGKKRKAKRSKDYDNEESSGEEDSEKEEDVKVPAKRRNKQSASKPPVRFLALSSDKRVSAVRIALVQ